jgi:hypothetical protein
MQKSSSKKRDYAAGVHLSRTPYPPPLHTVYVYKDYLFTQERGGGGRFESERKGEGQQFTKLGRK